MKSTTKTILIVTIAVLALGACSSRKFVRGYMADEAVISSIRAQVDTRDSVKEMLGSPSSVATFDNDNWYYYSKKSESLAFFKEDITELNIIAVRFDSDGYVTAVDRYTLDDRKNIDPVGETTPTHGRELSFIQELFGNIGRFGAGGPSNVQPGN
ncbi:MAG: outer membrane protein assembly factor BamE [Emcibacter sp.]|nr:outer membrane protein assembly factor BamE [Emcibacter sp.]